MSRAHLSYSDVAQPSRTFDGFDPDRPIEGFYRTKLVSGGHPVAVRLWWGAPLDPVTREVLDRGYRWNCTVNGRDFDWHRVWPSCADDPIDATEAEYLTKLQEWGEQHAPDSPQANPTKKIDLLTCPMPF